MRHILQFAFGTALATAALANDTTASTAAGGLVLKRTDAIDMLSEDLFVSANEIRVHYVFRNRTPKDVETVVAFPMPDRDFSQEYGQDTAYPSGFRTKVDGQPIKATLERKVVVKGEDHTAVLQHLRVPIAPDSVNDATLAMDRLSVADKKLLQTLGLAGDEEYDDTGKGMKHHLIPLWTVKDTYYWTQHFPAGRELVIDHSYVPGTGGSVGTAIANKQYRNDKDIRAMLARYCVDRAFLAALDARAPKGSDSPIMPDQWIDYVLTTGANWRSPIGSFRLVVDKGKPGNLVSFCESGVKKISSTQYEVRHKNWRPTRDLHVLIVNPAGWSN
jgi:hypothetical protein